MEQIKIIDTCIFHDYVGNDQAEVELMIDLFTQQSSTYYAELKIAYAHDDKNEWHDVAHRLKGMASFTGAEQLYESCKTAQDNYECSKNDKSLILKTIEHNIEQATIFLKTIKGHE